MYYYHILNITSFSLRDTELAPRLSLVVFPGVPISGHSRPAHSFITPPPHPGYYSTSPVELLNGQQFIRPQKITQHHGMNAG